MDLLSNHLGFKLQALETCPVSSPDSSQISKAVIESRRDLGIRIRHTPRQSWTARVIQPSENYPVADGFYDRARHCERDLKRASRGIRRRKSAEPHLLCVLINKCVLDLIVTWIID